MAMVGIWNLSNGPPPAGSSSVKFRHSFRRISQTYGHFLHYFWHKYYKLYVISQNLQLRSRKKIRRWSSLSYDCCPSILFFSLLFVRCYSKIVVPPQTARQRRSIRSCHIPFSHTTERRGQAKKSTHENGWQQARPIHRRMARHSL